MGTLQIRRSHLGALIFGSIGGTILCMVWFGHFSRVHVVEDYLSIDSGPGREITQLFPQEWLAVAFAGVLIVVALALAATGTLHRARDNG